MLDQVILLLLSILVEHGLKSIYLSGILFSTFWFFQDVILLKHIISDFHVVYRPSICQMFISVVAKLLHRELRIDVVEINFFPSFMTYIYFLTLTIGAKEIIFSEG